MKSILLAAAAFFLATGAHAADITVLAGGATKDVIEELIPAFEKATGHKVVATWDGAPAIRKRLAAGERLRPGDPRARPRSTPSSSRASSCPAAAPA